MSLQHSVAALLLLVASALCECPDGWTHYGNQCYKINNDPNATSFDEQLASCRKQGGTLASIHNKEQQDFINSLAQSSAPTPVYLGLYDAFKNGTWVWADGTPVDYNNWGQSKPDNATGFEFCSQLKTVENGTWDDEKCCGNGVGICVRADPDACPCPRNWTHLLETNSCYKLDFNGTAANNVTIPRTWAEARNACLAQGADLVSVHSTAELALTYSLAGAVAIDTNYANSVWIGLSRTSIATPWTWSDGTPFNFNAIIQQDNQGNPLCAAFVERYNGIQTTGGWHDIACNTLFKWGICKKQAFTS